MLLFIVVLLIAGGVIAYVGDRLGTYIGKKRLTAWGLRPRHTAMLYTVLSGGLIAILTLFTLIGYDHDVQRALLYGPRILAENARLEEKVGTQLLLIRVRQAQAQAAAARARDAERQAAMAEHSQSLVLARLDTAQGSLQRSRSDLTRRQIELQAARNLFLRVEAGLGATRSTLRQARTRLRTAQGAVQDARHNVRVAEGQYDRALGTVADLSRQGDTLSARNAALAQQNATLTQQNDALDLKNRQLLTQTTFLQGAHVIFHKGQEVGRRVLPTGLPAAELRRRLVSFLDDLSAEAARGGATDGDNGRAVRVSAQGTAGTPVAEDDALDALSQSIAGESGTVSGVVVIAVAEYNAFGGEQTPLALLPYDNVLVYAKGAYIADTGIDGSQPEDKILDDLQTFLTSRVQPDARSLGIIPRPDPRTGEPTVGEPTDSGQTLALVKQIERIGAGARVTARAAADTYSSGPLRLSLSASPPLPTPLAPPAPTIGRVGP